jgi:hypothetical protein
MGVSCVRTKSMRPTLYFVHRLTGPQAHRLTAVQYCVSIVAANNTSSDPQVRKPWLRRFGTGGRY